MVNDKPGGIVAMAFLEVVKTTRRRHKPRTTMESVYIQTPFARLIRQASVPANVCPL